MIVRGMTAEPALPVLRPGGPPHFGAQRVEPRRPDVGPRQRGGQKDKSHARDPEAGQDRKSVVQGTNGSVRGERGGRRSITTNKTNTVHRTPINTKTQSV